MNNSSLYIIIVSVLVFFFGCVILIIFTKKKCLGNKDKVFFKKRILLLNKLTNDKEKIIEIDKIYHKILLSIGYSGSFGNILKRNPKEIPDINKVWELHKLRNKLVHDLKPISERVLERSSLEYTLYINRLLKKVS